jgi:PIN domain nuclease of toxin-antitoxin system
MKLLLDTHAFLWADAEPDKLAARAKAACEDPANELVLSTASVWEIQIKVMLGKLSLRKPLRGLLQDWVRHNGLVILPVQLEHVMRLDTLPSLHRDPFDRLLVAQALVEGWPIVSHDSAVAQYPATVIW